MFTKVGRKIPTRVLQIFSLLTASGILCFLWQSVYTPGNNKNDKYLLKGHDKFFRIIYNRAGKCGSRTLLEAFEILSHYNGYDVILSNPRLGEIVSEKEKIEVIEYLNNIKKPVIYVRHMYMLDFGRNITWDPIYINMVRDPLERMVSQYYYHRYGDVLTPGKVATYSNEEKQQTFDECVLRNRSECLENARIAFYLIPYFCGQQETCRKPSRWAIETAKYNVISHYAVVGYVENISPFVEVLEGLVPSFFKGLATTWTKAIKSTRNKTRTAFKIPPSEEVVKIMRQRLSLEYEFYNFVKEHFAMLYSEVKRITSRS